MYITSASDNGNDMRVGDRRKKNYIAFVKLDKSDISFICFLTIVI